jgi:predicted O-methyltransferase YrrM
VPRLRTALRLASLAAREGPRPLTLARRAIREHAALQRTWELASLVAAVRRLRPHTVLELGTHRGGTLFCWAAVAAPDARLVSVDLPNEREGMGMREEDRARFSAFLRPGQTLECLRADSQLPATRDRVLAALGGRPVDFLWIDADHRLAGVTRDWELYGPLVRPGGLVAFHDIHPNPGFTESQVDRLWTRIRGGYRTTEFIDQDQPGGVGMGIGLLVQPDR